jgi:glycosyltransferase involved in cell wall biosynthesis
MLSPAFPEYCVRLAGSLSHSATIHLMLPEVDIAPYLSIVTPDVHLTPFHKPRLRQPMQQLQMLRMLVRQIRCVNPNVIHLQEGDLWFNLALPLLRRYPLVVTVHDPRSHPGDKTSQKQPQPILDFGVRRAKQLIVHSAEVKQVLVRGCHISPERVNVIPHHSMGGTGVEGDGLEDDHSILFFGRIWEYKGLEYLIRAEPFISAQVPDAKIVIAGEGEDFARYRRLMLHPERFTVHNEYVSDRKRAELFKRASVVVLPYVEATASGVIPVAYTFSKPVVATTVGGLPEMVEEAETGYLVPPRDERALADAIVRLLLDPPRRHAMGEKARRKSEKEYSPDVVAAQTLIVYERAAKGQVEASV